MTYQPEDRDEAYAEQRQEDLSVHDENWLSDYTDELNEHVDEGEPGAPSEQPGGEATDVSTDPMPPAGA